MSTTVTFGSIIDTNKPGRLIIGHARLDIDTLITTRLLLQANSGGGKSYALRKLIEQTAPHVQMFVLDREGEFASLREKFDFVLFGKVEHGADFDLNIKIAELLPKKLMELGVSAILDMSDLSIHEQVLFVKLFCDGMIKLPKTLWRPVVIVIDEIHKFCPQKEKCESAGAVIDQASLGRKRGQSLWGATQRLSKLNKDCAAELLNKLIGRTGLDVDVDRAADELGFKTKDDRLQLRDLEPGTFFSFGPAFAKGVNKLTIGTVETSHPQVGHRIAPQAPPAPEKIKKILTKMADLAEKAEKKEKDEADWKRELAELRGTRLALENKVKRLETATLAPSKERTIIQTINRLPAHADKDLSTIIELAKKLRGITGEPVPTTTQVFPRTKKTVEPFTPKPPKEDHFVFDAMRPEQEMRPGALRMLKACAIFGGEPISRAQMATIAGIAINGGSFSSYLSLLRTNGFVTTEGEFVQITPEGMKKAGDVVQVSKQPLDLLGLWMPRFRPGAQRMLQIVFDKYPQSISREDLGIEAGVDVRGGSFSSYLSTLRTNGLVITQGQRVTASKELFP